MGLAPLRSLRSALTKVRNGETQGLEGRFPGEITPLIDEFNTVLANAANAAIAAPGKDAQAAELARLYGGQLALSASPLGGLRAQLTLPGSQ